MMSQKKAVPSSPRPSEPSSLNPSLTHVAQLGLLNAVRAKLQALPKEYHLWVPAPAPPTNCWLGISFDPKPARHAPPATAPQPPSEAWALDAQVQAEKAKRKKPPAPPRPQQPLVWAPLTGCLNFCPLPRTEFEERACELVRNCGVSWRDAVICIQEEDAQAARMAAEARRLKEARKNRPATIVIAGVRAPQVNGSWMVYAPKNGARDGSRKHKKQVRDQVAAQHLAAKIKSEEHFEHDLDHVEVLLRLSRRIGAATNRFSVLKEVSDCSRQMRLRPSEPKRISKGVPFGPKTCWGFEFREQRLALKQKLYLLQQEWRKLRSERRAKMARVVMRLANHTCQSLRSALTRLVEKCLAERKVEHAPQEECVEGDRRWNVATLKETAWLALNSRPANGFSWVPDDVQGEADRAEGAQGTADQPSNEQHSNVIIQRDVGESEGSSLPSTSRDISFAQLSLAESPITDSTFHDRLFNFATIEWSANQQRGAILCDYEIPKDILDMAVFKDSPGNAIFRQHMFWRGDVEIEIVANTNLRQLGQIQFSFYYGDVQDAFFDLRKNIYLASQRVHSLLTANSCNTVRMCIPFEYLFPTMQINRIDRPGYRSLGRFLGMVISPLRAGPTSPQHATLNFFIRFPSNRFSGMVAHSIVGDMFPAFAAIVAAKELLDNNRDLPTMTTPGVPVVPINASSWCHGTGQATYNNILRLDPSCVLPYPDGRVPPVDEMSIEYVKNVFGLFKTVEWTSTATVGTRLFSINATPLDVLTEYPALLNAGENVYCVPPVGVLSSLFAYWRGSLELRIDLIGATEISGALAICYVPQVDKDYPLTLDQAKGCSYSVHHIRENRQIVFQIPYLASRPFWPRRSNLSVEYPTHNAPGAIFCFVFNRLIINSTIPDECNLIMYLRGGSDFEVAVPASPTLGLGFDPRIFIPENVTKRIVFVSGYTPCYAGQWRYSNIHTWIGHPVRALCESAQVVHNLCTGPVSGPIPVLRYNNVTDHVSQFHAVGFTFQSGKIYLAKSAIPYSSAGSKMKYVGNQPGQAAKSVEIESSVIKYFFFQKRDGYVYGWPVVGTVAAEQAAKKLVKYYWDHWDATYSQIKPEDMVAVCAMVDKINVQQDGFGTFTLIESDYWVPASNYFVPMEPLNPEVVAEAGDERSSIVAPLAAPQRSARPNAGSIVFGEQFFDLKDVCRRFQLYASDSFKVAKLLDTASWRTIVIRFPVMPQGLLLDIGNTNQIKEYWNRTREGPIPLISSGYRFFTGGIRYRACINVKGVRDADVKGKIFVQHRPDIIITSQRVIVQSGTTLGSDDMELPGYAAYHQFDDLNNVLSIEIPFYMPSLRTYSQRPTSTELARRYSNLGEVAIGVTIFSYSEMNFAYDLYYALADDARFSVFVGFPPVIDISQIPVCNPPSNVRTPRAIAKEQDDESVNAFYEEKISSLRQWREEGKLSKMSDGEFHNLTTTLELYSSLKMRDDFMRFWADFELKYGLDIESLDDGWVVPPDVQGDGPGDAVKRFLGFDKVESVAEKVEDFVGSESAQEMMTNLKESSSCLKTFANTIKNAIPNLQTVEDTCKKYVDLLINAVTGLIHALLNFNLKTILVSITSFFVQLKVVTWDATSSIISKLGNLFTSWFKSGTAVASEPIPADISGEAPSSDDDNALTGYVSSLVAGVAAVFAFVPKFTKARLNEIGGILMEGITKFTFCANHLFTFIKNNLEAIRRIGSYLFSDHPSMKKVEFLKEKEFESIHAWATAVVEVTDPRNENKAFTCPRVASSIYALASQASLLQVRLLDLNLNATQLSTMNQLISKIHKLQERVSKTHTAPPVRFEPFVYELTGPTGVGKSQLLGKLPYELFKFMHFTHEGELIYHRALGNAYWNNLRNQPVCTIDEKFPIKCPEFSGVQLAELFQLKSSCVFNPPMADIPDKNIRYNPLIVQYASNNPFPALDGMLDKSAVYRRRDALVHVEMHRNIKARAGPTPKYSDLTPAERAGGEFSWLQFRFYLDVCKEDCTPNNLGPVLDYSQFKEELCKRFRSYFLTKEREYRQSLRLMESLVNNEMVSDTLNVSEMFNDEWFCQAEGKLCTKAEDVRVMEFRKSYGLLAKISNRTEEFKANLKIALAEFQGDYRKSQELIRELREKKLSLLVHSDTQEAEATASVGYSDIRGEAPSAIPECVHSRLAEIIEDNKASYKFDMDKQAWIFDWVKVQHEWIRYLPESNSVNRSNKDIFELNYIKCKECYEFNEFFTELRVCYKSCPSEFANCPMKDLDSRRDFVSDILKHNHYLMKMFTLGHDCSHVLPDEFLSSLNAARLNKQKEIEEHDKVAEEVKTGRFKKFWESIRDSFMNIKWKKWLKRLTIFTAVLGFIGMIIGLWKNYNGENSNLFQAGAAVGVASSVSASRQDNLNFETENMLGNMSTSGDLKTLRPGRSMRTIAQKTIRGEMDGGIQNAETIKNKLWRNTFFLGTCHDAIAPGRCLGIYGQYGIVVDHFIELWRSLIKKSGDESMYFYAVCDQRISVIKLKFSQLKFIRYNDCSVSIVKLPTCIRPFQDIRKFIAEKKQHQNLNLKGSVVEIEVGTGHSATMSIKDLPFDYHGTVRVGGCSDWSEFKIADAYQYIGFNGAGKCGSVLLGAHCLAPIIGIHTAGSKSCNWGFSEMIYREMFVGLESLPSAAHITGEMETSKHFVNAYVVGIGKVPDTYAHMERGKTRIVPSEILQSNSELKEPFIVYAEPGVLSGKDPRIIAAGLKPWSPMKEGCKHHGFPLSPFPEDSVAEAVADLRNTVLANCKPARRPSCLTVDEAVGGFEGKPGYESINFSTSEGFPFTAWRPKGFSNKRWLFNFDSSNRYQSCKEELQNVLDTKWKMRLQNLVPPTVFTDCLKDCVVPTEKVLVPGKTRIFSISPVDFTIQQRQCTLDFSVAYMENRRNLEHMIGCNPDSMEWTLLAQDLLKTGSSIMTGDYSKYGDSLPCEFVRAAFSIISDWYRFNGCQDEELHQQLKIMAFEISNSVHLMFDHLYWCACGMPSGNSLTVILNSLANSLYMRVAWLEIMKDTEFSGLTNFHKLVKVFSYGDDLIVALHRLIKHLFNAVTISKFFEKFGLKFTNADKSDRMIPFASLAEAEFLKRGFAEHPTRTRPQVYLAPLKRESIENTVNWVWCDSFGRDAPGSPTYRDMCLQVCADSVRNAFSRGPKYYNEWVNKLQNFWLIKNQSFPCDSWENLDHKVFDLDYDISPFHKFHNDGSPKLAGDILN